MIPDEPTPEPVSDEHLDRQLAELLSAHRTEDLAVEDAKVVAAFYNTLAQAGVCVENDDVVSLTARWMNFTWTGNP